MDKKFCKNCGELKLVDEFTKSDKMKDGFRNECKKCSHLLYYNSERRRELNLEKDVKKEGSKKCRICDESKDINEFHLKRGTTDGHRSECKDCIKSVLKKYKEIPDFKEKEKEYDKKRYQKLKNETIERNRRRYKNNRKDILDKKKIYREKEENKIRYKKWCKENKDIMAKHQQKYKSKYPHIIAWRSILHSTLDRLGTKKEGHTIDLLGYSVIDLKEHIDKQFTKGMSWDNYGEWHIDHHFPVVSFSKDTDVKIVCALSNLKPMWSTTRIIDGILYEGNLNKGDKIPTN